MVWVLSLFGLSMERGELGRFFVVELENVFFDFANIGTNCGYSVMFGGEI